MQALASAFLSHNSATPTTKALALDADLAHVKRKGGSHVLTLTPKMVDALARLEMGQGLGDGERTACVMHMAAIADAMRRGDPIEGPTDRLECACVVLRGLAIKLNDANWWSGTGERKAVLGPLVPRLLDSRTSIDVGQRRAYRCADAAWHEFAAPAVERLGHFELAVAIHALPRISDYDTAFRAAEHGGPLHLAAVATSHQLGFILARAREATVASMGLRRAGNAAELAGDAAASSAAGMPFDYRVEIRGRLLKLFAEVEQIGEANHLYAMARQ